ncbi:MAG: coaE operon protein [Halodesulfurarchaeum sp.]
MTYRIDVTAEAPVKPTERTDAVREAIETLFPDADVETREDRVIAETHDVSHLRKRLFEQRILDTARSVFFDRRGPNGFSFELKKQAALTNVVNFAVGNPSELGEIEVAITVHDPSVEAFIDYLAPATDDGNPPEFPGDGE